MKRETMDRSGGALEALERSWERWMMRKLEGDPRIEASEEWLRVFNLTGSRKKADMAECRKRLDLLERLDRERATKR